MNKIIESFITLFIVVFSIMTIVGCGGGSDDHSMDLTITEVRARSISIRWNLGGAGTEYNVYLNGVYYNSTTYNEWTYSNLSPETTYCMQVGANCHWLLGCDDLSDTVCATTLRDYPPTKPTNLVPTAVSAVQIDLTWDASSDDYMVDGYNIFRDDMYIGFVLATSYADVGLNPAKQYCYNVSAYDDLGNESTKSNKACTSTLPDQSAPSTPTNVSTVFFPPARIDIKWDVSIDNHSVAGYNIYRDSNFIYSVTDTSTSDTVQADFTQHCYKISAYDVSGNESALSESSCVPNWGFTTIDSQNALYNTSITTDTADNVHISYTNGTDPPPGSLIDNGVKYATNASGGWIVETVDSAGGKSSIAVDSGGNAHISYLENGIKYATNISGTWVKEIIDSDGRYTSIAIDSADGVHISYTVWGSTSELKYATNTSGAWISQTLQSYTGAYLYNPSIAIDSTDNVHICYAKGGPPGDLEYITNASGAWTKEAIGDNTWFQSIAIDSADNIHITHAYDDPQYTTNTSGVWLSEIIEDDRNLGAPDGAIDPADNMHICYYKFYDNNRIKYATNASGAWNIYPIYSPVSVSFVSIDVDSTGAVHISYISDYKDLVYMKIK